MVNRSPTLQTRASDTWLKATWEEFVALADHSDYANGRFYYDQGYMRIEMSPLGSAHSQDNSIISTAIILFGIAKTIPIKELSNASFRKTGIRECQPDLAFYIGAALRFPPRNNAPINLNELEPPTLVVEVAASSLNDDLGAKRLLYERLGVQEYWVVNVQERKVIAFSVAEERSGQIQTSQVLPGLDISLVEEVLQRSQTEDDVAISRWLLATLSQS